MHSILRRPGSSPALFVRELIRPLRFPHIFRKSPDKPQEEQRGSALRSTTYIAKTVVTPRDAIASHVRWKIALLLAAEMRESLSERATRSLTHPEECSIHKWLQSTHTDHLRGSQEYRTVLALHSAFHAQMLQIANLLQAGHFEQAERCLNKPGPFQDASNSLANAIMALERPIQPGISHNKIIFNK
jgi:hypothetical protein